IKEATKIQQLKKGKRLKAYDKIGKYIKSYKGKFENALLEENLILNGKNFYGKFVLTGKMEKLEWKFFLWFLFARSIAEYIGLLQRMLYTDKLLAKWMIGHIKRAKPGAKFVEDTRTVTISKIFGRPVLRTGTVGAKTYISIAVNMHLTEETFLALHDVITGNIDGMNLFQNIHILKIKKA
ncbi:hypothetical protein ACJX0J_026355, partial [Zea mays]